MTPVKPLPEGAELQPDGKVRYRLRFPFKHRIGNDEALLESVVIRRKTMRDNRALKDITNVIEEVFQTIKLLTGLAEIEVDAIDEFDAQMIGEIIGSFATPGPATSTGASA